MLDDLKQHSRRDSLPVAGIPENGSHDDTDAAVIKVCELIKVDPPVEPQDISVSQRVCLKRDGQHRQIIVKFATRKVSKHRASLVREHAHTSWGGASL